MANILTELTDPDAVIAAAREYDEMGEIEFLEQYGFGQATKYLLKLNGKSYASKAIVAVAYKYQFPKRGALTSDQLVGGANTVERRLKKLGFDVVPLADDWTKEEFELLMQDYLAMLQQDAAGRSVDRKAHRDALRRSLRTRSFKSIESKHQNISAILIDAGLPYFRGYRPVDRWPAELRDVVIRAVSGGEKQVSDIVDLLEQVRTPTSPDFSDVVVEPPSKDAFSGVRNNPVRIARKLNHAALDEANRKLGLAGEDWVVSFETARLARRGRQDLANQINWIARENGDGLGYDILSFDETGEQLFIEVKTTNGGLDSLFLVTANELAVSREKGNAFSLYRVFDFGAKPRLYMLRGDLRHSLHLNPVLFRAFPKPV